MDTWQLHIYIHFIYHLFVAQSLKLFSDHLKSQEDFTCSEGEKDVNRKKNRYKDILPCK